jgi:hypothetical protein
MLQSRISDRFRPVEPPRAKTHHARTIEMNPSASSSDALAGGQKGNTKPFTCEICGKGYEKKYGLDLHRRSHSQDPNVQWPFFCTACDKRFARQYLASNHLGDANPDSKCAKEGTVGGLTDEQKRVSGTYRKKMRCALASETCTLCIAETYES